MDQASSTTSALIQQLRHHSSKRGYYLPCRLIGNFAAASAFVSSVAVANAFNSTSTPGDSAVASSWWTQRSTAAHAIHNNKVCFPRGTGGWGSVQQVCTFRIFDANVSIE
jgi:hypothetical protein